MILAATLALPIKRSSIDSWTRAFCLLLKQVWQMFFLRTTTLPDFWYCMFFEVPKVSMRFSLPHSKQTLVSINPLI